MKRVRLYAHRGDRKLLMERLQRLGVMEVECSEQPEEGFTRPDTEPQAVTFDRLAATGRQALAVLQEAVPESKGLLAAFSGRREISYQDFSAGAAKSQDTLQECHRILALQKKKAEWAAEIVRIRTALAQLEPWEGLDVSFRLAGTKSTAAVAGALPGEYGVERLLTELAERAPALTPCVEIVSAAREQTCFFLLCPRDQLEQAETALRGMGYSKPAVAGGLPRGTPKEEMQRLQGQMEALQRDIAGAEEELRQAAGLRRDIEEAVDYYAVRAEKYRMIGRLDHSRNTFIAAGYIPAPDVPLLRSQLEERFAVVIETEDADPETAPVKLRNNAFNRPAESITEMYALPLASDIDPTPVMSFFYYLFFGMMLSDAGYGLLLVLGSLFLLKKCRPEPAMRRNLTLFLYCGVSTVFWGLMFGSFFGDAIPVISRTFFGHEVALRPLLFDPMEQAVGLLVLSLVLGFVQILVGLGAKFYTLWKGEDRLGAVFDAGLWITTLLGIALLAGGIALLPALTPVGAAVAVVSLLGLVLTQGRTKKGPMKILSGVASLYDITGYVSDLMSYSRLMALGLTTAAMASVFNMLGTLAGGGIAGLILLLILFPVGHAITFGLNALGAYVHTIRLQYVELFSKFYEGGGRPFRPFAFRSQYIRIKEETDK